VLVFVGYALIAVIVAALLFYAAVALVPEGLSVVPERDEIPFALPENRRLDSADLARIRIPVAMRGYRFTETEDLIDRLVAEISDRDEELARLRSAPRPAESCVVDERPTGAAGHEPD
jgi:hypothetical protein